MLPLYKETTVATSDPSIGTITVPKQPKLKETLEQMLLEKINRNYTPETSLNEVDKADKLEGEKNRLLGILRELQTRDTTEIAEQETTPSNLTIKPKWVGGEVVSASAKYEERLRLLQEDYVTRINNLQKEITDLRTRINSNEAIKSTPTTVEISTPIKQIKVPNLGEIKPPTPPAEEIKREERLKDLINPSSQKEKDTVIKTTTPQEIIYAPLPSIEPDTRILRMPKISKPRPRLINGLTQEERVAVLTKPDLSAQADQAGSPHDVIDTVIEKVVDVIPDTKTIDLTIERIHAYNYQTMSNLTEKLIRTKVDALKIFAKMFSDKPTTTGPEYKSQ